MPTKLTVGYCRKKGLADYGSVGANCSLEIELDNQIVGNANRLREAAETAYLAARQAVEDQLAREDSSSSSAPGSNGTFSGQSRNRRPSRSSFRAATESQLRAIRAIAKRTRTDLDPLLSRLGTSTLEQLSIANASKLIDEMKAKITDGT
ncbi:hypothetical protein [Roseiconus lacunae]|uniref:Uncharacterized protein n=1 Tax=Roseiconus lacunae TaxID=2605694 RepID=A0ABT7PR23_9BACT|nr:hypothetical protein [Roseiconus lacunae]MDM4018959.1 hypothetical protein [Roseiconus lacunae]